MEGIAGHVQAFAAANASANETEIDDVSADICIYVEGNLTTTESGVDTFSSDVVAADILGYFQDQPINKMYLGNSEIKIKLG